MPKMKTHSGCKKRFKRTSTGKIKRSKAYSRQHAWAKTNKQTRDLRGGAYLSDANKKNIEKLLPY